MLQSIKRLTKHSAVYGIGHIVSRSIGFLLLPIHTNYLLPDAYGIVSLLFSSLAILNVIFSYGLDVAFLRFFILCETKEEKECIFSTATWMILGTGILFSAVLFFIPTPFSRLIFLSDQYPKLVRYASGIVLADALGLLPFLVLRGEEKSSSYVFLNSLKVGATLGLNIVFVAVLKKGIEGVFVSNLIASIFTLWTLLPIFVRWLRFRFNKKILSDLLRFGLPYIPAGLAIVIMDQISRFFLARMKGEEATGIFSASYKLGMFMAIVVAAFRFAWHPFFLSTSKEKDAPKIFARVLTYFLLVTGFFFLAISFFIDEIIEFQLFKFRLFGEGYATGAPIVPIVLLAYIGYGIYVNFIIGIYLEKKTYYLPWITGAGALVSVATNFLLIPSLGIFGAAWAAFLGYAAMAVCLYVVSQRLYPIRYEWIRILKLVLITALLFSGVTWFLGYTSASIRIFILFSMFPFLWVVGFFEKGEKNRIHQIMKAGWNKVFDKSKS